MNAAAIRALQRLAALKSQRALGELSVMRAREAAARDALAGAERAVAETYDMAGAQALPAWRAREGLERAAAARRRALAQSREAAAEAERKAAAAMARETGAEALAERLAAAEAAARSRQAERGANVLRALRLRPEA